MSHEELLQREDAPRRPARPPGWPDADDVTPVGADVVLLLDGAGDLDDPSPEHLGDRDTDEVRAGHHEGAGHDRASTATGPAAAGRRGRRIALAAAATALLALLTAAAVHEITLRRQVAALERTHLTVEESRIDLRPLLYARLAGSRLTANVPILLRVTNPGEGPVRVVAVQVGGVSVTPVENVLVPPGGRATLNALARMTCADVPPRAAPGLAVLPDGQAAALLADTHGHRLSVTLAAWPALEQRLPTLAPCDRFTWAGSPTAP